MKKKSTIVLINPPSEVWLEGTRLLLPILNTLPQIGIASLAAVLEHEGLHASIIDAQALGMTPDKTIAWAASHEPSIVGLTGYTSSVDSAAAIAEGIKKVRPGVKTVIGGPHVTAIPEQTMKTFDQFDYGLVGEGEISTPLLFRTIMDDADPASVPGAVFRKNGAIRMNERPPLINDLDTIPPPAYAGLPGFPKAYHPPIFHSPKGRAISLVTSRGCPYRCTFCDRSLFGNRFRFHSVPYIVDLIKRLRAAYGIDHFFFYDDNFTADGRHLAELCEEIMRLGFKITFSCDARADLVDREVLALMKRAGAWMISYGIETANPELLKLLDKSLSLDRAARAVRLTSEAGIITKGLFMIGVPGETQETIENTRRFILDLPFDLINLSKFTPYPGSDIYRDIDKYGRFDGEWKQMSAMNFVFWPNTIDPAVLQQKSGAILMDFYRNSKRARRIIGRVINRRDAARLLFAGLLKATGVPRRIFMKDDEQ